MAGELTTGFVAKTMAARGYEVTAGPDVAITGGAADSRAVRPGDLFTAFPGDHTDGNLYVADALRNGAVAAICARAPEGPWPRATIVVTPDTTRAVAELAHAWRVACGPRVVGITGSVGKTTAKELIAGTLSKRFRTHRSAGNFNSREGLPLALMSLRATDEVSVLEMAMDSKGEIAELCRIAGPVVGVVMNIGLVHVSKLGSQEAIAAEKLSLPRSLPREATAVLNVDDPRVAAAIPGLGCRVLTFGAGADAAIRRGAVTDHGLEGTSFEVTFEGETRTARSRIPGEHTIPAALAAIGVGMALGLPFGDAIDALGCAAADGRMKVRRSDTGAVILDDRYNSSPASLAGALHMLKTLPGRHIALLGRMAELGQFEAEEHRRAGRIAAETCDALYAAGEECRAMVSAARAAGLAETHWFATKDEAATAARAILREGDHVLVKASRGVALETVIPLLEGTP